MESKHFHALGPRFPLQVYIHEKFICKYIPRGIHKGFYIRNLHNPKNLKCQSVGNLIPALGYISVSGN